MAGAGHMIQLSHSEAFSRLVSDWLEEVEGRRTRLGLANAMGEGDHGHAVAVTTLLPAGSMAAV